MRWLAAIAGALTLAGPAEATIEVARTATTAERAAFTVELGAELFLRLQGTKVPDADWGREYEIQRAQLTLVIRYGEALRVQLEPDFGGGAFGVRDVFLQLEPTREFDVKVGRVKSPYSWLDNLSRFELPSLSRGLVTDVLQERLGFGGRQIALLPRLRLRDLPLKPWITGGVMGDLSTELGADGAAAIGVKPAKGLDVYLSWHHRAGARIEGAHGNAVSLAVAYDRKGLLAVIEGHLAHAARLRRDGRAPTEDAGLWAARALVSVPLELNDALFLSPFVAGAILDPELGSGGDLGFEIAGGVNLWWIESVRFGLQVDAQLVQDDFLSAERTRLTAFLAAKL